MRLSKLTVETLEGAGVDRAFGLVGSTILRLLDDVNDSDIDYISTRHEQVAASMAVGYTLASRTPSVSTSHVGPGAANQVIGVTAAYRDNVPLISITGNEPSDLLGRDVNHEWDVMGVFERFTKHNVQIRPEDAPAQLRNAVVRSMTGMPGAVHVDIPQDVAEVEIDHDERELQRLRDSGLPDSPVRSRPPERAVERTVELLTEADRPLVLAGSEFRWFGGESELEELAERIDVPVVTTQNARGALDENHPRSLGYVANSGLEAPIEYFENADLVVGVGTSFSEKATDSWRLPSPEASIVQATMRADELNRYSVADVSAIADPKSFLGELVDAIDENGRDLSFREVAEPARSAYESERRQALTPEDPSETNGVDPRRVVRAVDDRLDSFAYTTGGGVHNTAPRLLPVEDLDGRFVTANFTGMSQGFPLAMGAKLALDRPIVTFEGDGGFAMVMQDLETAVREDIPVKIIVFNNSAYMSHAVRQKKRYGRYIGTRHSNPEFDGVAEDFGMFGKAVTDDREVEEAVDQLLSVDGPGLLDVHIDPDIGTDAFS